MFILKILLHILYVNNFFLLPINGKNHNLLKLESEIKFLNNKINVRNGEILECKITNIKIREKRKEKYEFPEIYTPDNREYFYYPALPDINCFTFKVRTFNTAYILLAEEQGFTENSIVISLGSVSYIQQTNNDGQRNINQINEPNYVSGKSFHHFWIKWMNNGTIEVGFVNGTKFLKLLTSNMPLIKYIGIKSLERTDKWILEFDEPKCPDLSFNVKKIQAICYETVKSPAKLISQSSEWIIYQNDLLQQLHIDYENYKNSINFHSFTELYLKWQLYELEENYKIAKENHKKILIQKNNYYNDEFKEYLKNKIYDNIKRIFFEYYENVAKQLNKFNKKEITLNDIDNNYNEMEKVIASSNNIISKDNLYKQNNLNLTSCSSEAIFPYPTNSSACQCKTGWAGNGLICGIDSDNDKWPDKDLGCSDKYCKADNCPSISNTGQDDLNSNGVGDACDDDMDGDGVTNNEDNCPKKANSDQRDSDNDTIGDECDNCPKIKNSNQLDNDQDGMGNVCDDDIDNDGFLNDEDNCRMIFNEDQLDSDDDDFGDKCDNCPHNSNKDQSDIDFDEIGDECDNDIDNDTIANANDNCPKIYNINQTDSDDDGWGDECDNCPLLKNSNQTDYDNDGIGNDCDNCPEVINKDQIDFDDDKIGDLCDNCPQRNPKQKDDDDDLVGDECDDGRDSDKDGRQDNLDNCPNIANSNQLDSNNNGIGNACEENAKDLDKCDSNKTWNSFSRIQIINLDRNNIPKLPDFKNINSTVYQFAKSDPSLAVGYDYYGGVDYHGVMTVNKSIENDGSIGLVFSYQSNRKFYLVNWHEELGLKIEVISSSSGPGTELRKFLLLGKNLKQGKIIWQDKNKLGFSEDYDYKWTLIHRPEIGLIQLRIYEDNELIIDSGKLKDHTYKGGRLGVYTFGQSMVQWKNFNIKCNESLS